MGPGGVGDEGNELLVEQECRVAVLGEPAVGKTTLVNRFVRGKFILVRTELDHVETLSQKKIQSHLHCHFYYRHTSLFFINVKMSIWS